MADYIRAVNDILDNSILVIMPCHLVITYQLEHLDDIRAADSL